MKRTNRARVGFTLIELMVALAAGTIAIGAVYYLSGTANQTYNTQMRLSETQMGLRMAGEQVRRDFSRAGYLSARQAMNTGDPSCSAQQVYSTVAFQALTVFPDGSVTTPIANMVGTNVTRLDRVQLVGNYATTEDYKLEGVTGTPDLQVFVGTQSFMRSFGLNPAEWQTPFEEAFAAGRLLRIEDKDGGRYFYTIIGSVGGPTPTVSLSQAPDACVSGSFESALASPVVAIEYEVAPINGTDTEAAFQGLDSAAPGGQRMALVRREINVANGAHIAGSERIVLDYVTEFRVDAVIESAPGTFMQVDEGSAPSINAAPPDQFRSAIVTLAARAPDLDRKVTTNIGRINGAMVTYQVGTNPNDSAFGIARVRTLRSEIFLPNLLR
jgi:prepilin-type N-terminal cleavage/methylation domain-containing protein